MRNFFVRNKIIASVCDYIVAFIPEGVEANGTKNVLVEKPLTLDIRDLQKLSNYYKTGENKEREAYYFYLNIQQLYS